MSTKVFTILLFLFAGLDLVTYFPAGDSGYWMLAVAAIVAICL